MGLLFFKTLALLSTLVFQSTIGCHSSEGMAVNITANSAILIWTVSTCRDLSGYAIHSASPILQRFIANISQQYTYYILSNLYPHQAYFFEVQPIRGARLHNLATDITFMTAEAVPGNPSGLHVHTTSRTATVTWYGCIGATTYHIGFKENGTLSMWLTVETSTRTVTINNLQPSTAYMFRVYCENMAGRSSFSPITTRSTLSDEVPSRVRLLPVSTTSITATISWICTGATKYFINYANRDSGESETSVAVGTSPETIQNLLPNTTYRVKVVCENEYGRTSSSTHETFQTKSYQPTIQSVVVSSTSAVVTWQPQGGIQMSYEILATDDNGHQLHTTAYGKYIHTVVNLRPETVYSFQVRAVSSSEGRSTWSEPMNAITLPKFPGQVINFTTNETTESSVMISWKSPLTTVDFFVICLTLQSDASSNVSTVEVSLGNSTEMYTYHKLLPLTSYNISIWAVNKAGQGPLASLNVDTLELTTAPNTLAASLGAVIGILLFAVLIGVILLACVIRRKHLALNHKPNSKERETTEGLSYLQCRQDVDSREANSYGLTNVYSEDDENSIRSVHVSETELFFKSLTLPPRIPARDYVQEEPMVKPSLQFTSLPVWPDEVAFQKESGWFDPSLSHVLRKKLSYREEDFRKLGSGIFYMFHKSKKKARYINYSFDLGRSLSDLLSKLYEKERCDLNPLEVELKYYSPSADKWCIRVWRCEKKALLLERAKRIIEYQTLRPHGLNKHLKVAGREMWAELSEWYEKHRPKHVKKAALT